jgi:hypothetical protein
MDKTATKPIEVAGPAEPACDSAATHRETAAVADTQSSPASDATSSNDSGDDWETILDADINHEPEPEPELELELAQPAAVQPARVVKGRGGARYGLREGAYGMGDDTLVTGSMQAPLVEVEAERAVGYEDSSARRPARHVLEITTPKGGALASTGGVGGDEGVRLLVLRKLEGLVARCPTAEVRPPALHFSDDAAVAVFDSVSGASAVRLSVVAINRKSALPHRLLPECWGTTLRTKRTVT